MITWIKLIWKSHNIKNQFNFYMNWAFLHINIADFLLLLKLLIEFYIDAMSDRHNFLRKFVWNMNFSWNWSSKKLSWHFNEYLWKLYFTRQRHLQILLFHWCGHIPQLVTFDDFAKESLSISLLHRHFLACIGSFIISLTAALTSDVLTERLSVPIPTQFFKSMTV